MCSSQLPTAESVPEDLTTKELLAKTRSEPVGMYYKDRGDGGYIVYSLKGGTYTLNKIHMKKHPTSGEFNVWFQTHTCAGWRSCTGPCAGRKGVSWYDVAEEDAPFLPEPKQAKQFGYALRECVGYCRMARRLQQKE